MKILIQTQKLDKTFCEYSKKSQNTKKIEEETKIISNLHLEERRQKKRRRCALSTATIVQTAQVFESYLQEKITFQKEILRT